MFVIPFGGKILVLDPAAAAVNMAGVPAIPVVAALADISPVPVLREVPEISDHLMYDLMHKYEGGNEYFFHDGNEDVYVRVTKYADHFRVRLSRREPSAYPFAPVSYSS